MSIALVAVSPATKQSLVLPFSGAGVNVPQGTIVMPGATGGTNKGVAIPTTASTLSRALGLLGENHVFANSGDALTQTNVDWFLKEGALATGNTAFPSHPVELLAPVVLVRIDYNLASTVAVASYSTPTITITSMEANFDGGWAYCNAGTGIGELAFVKSSASGSITLFTTPAGWTYDSTSKLTKVLPFFYEQPTFLVNTTTVPALLDSQAAAGGSSGSRAVCLGQLLMRNGDEVQLNPLAHNFLTKLNALTQFNLASLLAFQNTAFYPNA